LYIDVEYVEKSLAEIFRPDADDLALVEWVKENYNRLSDRQKCYALYHLVSRDYLVDEAIISIFENDWKEIFSSTDCLTQQQRELFKTWSDKVDTQFEIKVKMKDW
jgi:hypothetical protein